MHSERATSPLLRDKAHGEPSLFRPENLLREARRQKGVAPGGVPPICVLDPDGDLVRHLRATRQATRCAEWACYHSAMDVFVQAGERFGVVGCAVGAPYAVLVAEQMFASGCELLVSVTSAGRIADDVPGPHFILIDRALRDEGTSLHYLPPGDFAAADPALVATAMAALADAVPAVRRGATWTTDAPFRETASAIAAAGAAALLAVEMEAAALYAFAAARGRDVLCFAHVTNRMAQVEGDFEKGEADGATASLAVVGRTAAAWRAARR